MIRKNMREAHYSADVDAAMMEFLGKVLAQLRREGKAAETDVARPLDLRWLARAKAAR